MRIGQRNPPFSGTKPLSFPSMGAVDVWCVWQRIGNESHWAYTVIE